MYEGELKTARIETELVVDQTLNDMAVDQVMLDPSRLLQVSGSPMLCAIADPIGAYQHFHKCGKVYQEFTNTQNHSHTFVLIYSTYVWSSWRLLRAISCSPGKRRYGFTT